MIISHKYKYIFIQVNQTASTAVAQELCQFYGGEPILWQHATYQHFLKTASLTEKKYFLFAGVRNPLDVTVSLYFRRKLDLFGHLRDIRHRAATIHNYKLHYFIVRKQPTFADFFKKFYRFSIYNEWKTLKFNRLNAVYRFENLQSDFSEILKKIGISQVRPVLIINQTPKDQPNFQDHYPVEIQGWAKIIFGDYMRKWGYQFPADWAEPNLKQRFYYYIFLKPKYLLQLIYHRFFDQSLIYCSLYGNRNNLISQSYLIYKLWRAKMIK
ncbi:MAG: hypothetical protein A3D39_01735 [Candidatus Buchananbacteria bacterium RIFCSPHIGHO2_02_FULL_39_17]|uniref:Sulfotransferase domain-containing protein n=1 Tax=Candidatus Buchananbacteria bacterium RIFCSPLOWO2_01_FULL_40_23b TaxID=1797544 RepID=A0A1G1YS12_9BACT|nr:MAG: hypothetical protein A3D39_01735 [Candidatus Buchananbacteria bacterium RIFCSPHIGHO2_02_FULL_39_17]OGY55094.1 MAG: hypothetical protein A2912_00070 [Candidatus Buchananbacteria bacterium RIFCSPLOWO2_01_FULL_40_23b]